MSSVQQRRKFLSYLAASPLFAASAGTKAQSAFAEPINTFYRTDLPEVIQSPKDAINVFDFEARAQQLLPPAHFGYLNTGVTDNYTRERNQEAFNHIQMRVKRLSGVGEADTSTELFGRKLSSPILLAPVSAQGAFHQEAEVAVARAAREKQTLPIVATYSSKPLQDIREAYDDSFWFQLYPPRQAETREAVIRRAEAVGCDTLVLTIDMFGGTSRDEAKYLARMDNRNCADCHQAPPGSLAARRLKPTISGLDYAGSLKSATWDLVAQIKQTTQMNLVVKGVVTAEDAKLAMRHGADGIVVSNHGGRAFESGRSTIESLPEVVAAVRGRIPVLIDSGFRRGNDVYKALALGADAVCIGRPYLWGLASFGQAGVEAVIDIINAEFQHSMKKMGASSLKQISRKSVEWG